MRNRAIALLLMMVLWFGSGCASPESTAPGAPAAASPSPAVASNPETSALPADVENRLRDAAAQALNLSPDAVTLQTAEAVDWNNACLGTAQPDEMCAEVITPGYRVVFTSAQGEAIVHSDRTGSSYRLVSP